MKNSYHSIETLGKALEKVGIVLVFRQNVNGIIYGVTYVDHQTKCVYNGSDLGKQYSANALQERCLAGQNVQTRETAERQSVLKSNHLNNDLNQPEKFANDLPIKSNLLSLLEDLLDPSQAASYVPHQLKKSKRKKRKNISNNQ